MSPGAGLDPMHTERNDTQSLPKGTHFLGGEVWQIWKALQLINWGSGTGGDSSKGQSQVWRPGAKWSCLQGGWYSTSLPSDSRLAPDWRRLLSEWCQRSSGAGLTQSSRARNTHGCLLSLHWPSFCCKELNSFLVTHTSCQDEAHPIETTQIKRRKILLIPLGTHFWVPLDCCHFPRGQARGGFGEQQTGTIY